VRDYLGIWFLSSHFFNGQLTFFASPADLAKNRTVSEDENGQWKNIHHQHSEGSVRNLVSLCGKRIKSDALFIPIWKLNFKTKYGYVLYASFIFNSGQFNIFTKGIPGEL